jgi:hypothetical protein
VSLLICAHPINSSPAPWQGLFFGIPLNISTVVPGCILTPSIIDARRYHPDRSRNGQCPHPLRDQEGRQAHHLAALHCSASGTGQGHACPRSSCGREYPLGPPDSSRRRAFPNFQPPYARGLSFVARDSRGSLFQTARHVCRPGSRTHRRAGSLAATVILPPSPIEVS